MMKGKALVFEREINRGHRRSKQGRGTSEDRNRGKHRDIPNGSVQIHCQKLVNGNKTLQQRVSYKGREQKLSHSCKR
jgi:hypothetical protein